MTQYGRSEALNQINIRWLFLQCTDEDFEGTNVPRYSLQLRGLNMQITRIYTGDDGQSHFEDLEIDKHPNLDSLSAVTSIRFRIGDPGNFSDWHQESRRNYIITLSGEGEIGIGDGSLRRFGPGQVMLVEDLTGQGHTTFVSSSEPRITIAVPLTNQIPGT